MELINGSVIPYEEDKDYEFKMHLNLCEDELPDWLKSFGTRSSTRRPRTRQAISRNLNAFLNSGNGGIVLLGIADDGEVKGLSLSLQQKDHLLIALQDLLNRYTPPVPTNLYRIKYIPVVNEVQHNEPVVTATQKWSPPHPGNCSSTRAHLLRSNKPCWCFNNAVREAHKGHGYTKYVVEILLLPTSPVLKPHLPPLKPLFLNEDGECFIRKCASVWKMSYSEVIQMTKEEVSEYVQSQKAFSSPDVSRYISTLQQ